MAEDERPDGPKHNDRAARLRDVLADCLRGRAEGRAHADRGANT